MEKGFQRNVAHKMSARQILDAPYQKFEGENPNFLLWGGTEVYRISLLGVVVQKNDLESYVGFLIDDGSATISCRYFEMERQISRVLVGDVVNIVGRPREFNTEKYLLIESVHVVDPKWLRVRKIELESKAHSIPIIEHEEAIMQTPADLILRRIKELDKGEGVGIDSLGNIKNIDELIGALLREGSIFEIRPGKIKVLE